MKRNEEITILAEEIMVDITNSRLPLHNILLKASRLSLLLDIPHNVNLFKLWAKSAEENQFIAETYQAALDAAKDPSVSLSSANPNEYVRGFGAFSGNAMERHGLRNEIKKVVQTLAGYRAEAYNFALGIYSKWQFGNVAESVFERKRARVEPVLNQIFPDAQQRLNSIEQNLRSQNPEDWKNAAASCRALLMDIADTLNPPKTPDEKEKYINRLKEFISPKVSSQTKKKLLNAALEELKGRIEHTVDLTQGAAHKDRPTVEEAETVVLYTYLAIAELLSVYQGKQTPAETKPEEKPSEK